MKVMRLLEPHANATLVIAFSMLLVAVAAFSAKKLKSSHGKPIVVACLGDSITAGFWQHPEDLWPAQVQASLGSAWQIINLAQAGKTAQRAGDQPYWDTQEWVRAQALQAEIVVLMLGTNDAKTHNWDEDRYVRDLHDLIDQASIGKKTTVFWRVTKKYDSRDRKQKICHCYNII